MARRAFVVAALVAIGAMGACGTEPSTEQTIAINHSSFGVTKLHYEAGDTVTFVVTNNDPIDHEFLIGDEEVQRIHEEGTEAHHGAKPGEISIPANTTRSTTYTFSSEGTLVFGCHLPGHYAYGMRGTIEIG